MSNADLIERLNNYINNTDDCVLRKEAADAIELADKRIAELAKFHAELHVEHGKAKIRIGELERKLAVAREVLKTIRWTPQMGELWKIAEEALAQIGGEDASS